MAKGKRGKKNKPTPSPPQGTPAERDGRLPPPMVPDKATYNRPDPIFESTSAKESGPFFTRTDWIAGLVTTLLCLVAYLYTLAPDVTLEDSGELAVGSMYAGVPHPPGYPVWTIYSWIFTKILPFSNIAWRVAVSSAVAAAFSCGIIAMMVTRGSHLMLQSIRDFKELESKLRDRITLVAGIAAGVILGFNGFIWIQAVIVEVYTLGILTFALTLVFLMRWFHRPTERLYLYIAYFCFGLCFTNHQTLILAAVGIELLILIADRKLGRDFLFSNCVVYVIGLILSLKGAEDPTSNNTGVFKLYNLVGVSLMALLLGTCIRSHNRLVPLSISAGYFALATLFGISWENQIEAAAMTNASKLVKMWAFANTLLLLGLAAYSWINRPKDEPGILTHWMPLLNTRACWLAAAALYLYMPIASMTNPPMNWAYPRTPQGFKHAVTRGQYDAITPSSLNRMFVNHSHDPKTTGKDSKINFGQVGIFVDEAAEEFSMSYILLAGIPLVFVYRMQLREILWIAGLTGIFVSTTLFLIYLINPTVDEQNRHLNKVFFASTHLFIALGLGGGLALIVAAIATRQRQILHIIFWGLGILAIGECVHTRTVLIETEFLTLRSAAILGLILIAILLVFTGLSIGKQTTSKSHALTYLALALLLVLPLRPALNNWSDNEQRGHLFGYWFGHDMFSPPFEIYEEMDQDAILFGGTDPGRFCPTYFIFCESFTAAKHKRDPDFDRRDVYIITQNALADGTYLNYIRAHYNPSAQIDGPFFKPLVESINKHPKRKQINRLLYFGIFAGLIIFVYAILRYTDEQKWNRQLIGTAVWGGVLIVSCFAATPENSTSLARVADSWSMSMGDRVAEKRRIAEIYPAEEITTPSPADNQSAFRNYYDDARMRMLQNRLHPGENVSLSMPFACPAPDCNHGQIKVYHRLNIQTYGNDTSNGIPCPQCQRSLMQPATREPRVQVAGNASVMAINALLAKDLFDANRDHSFYLEESMPLHWMNPYLVPYGIIFKLEAEREFEISSITPSAGIPVEGVRQGDTLTPYNEPTDTQVISIEPGTFTVGSVSTNGVIQSIQVNSGGRYDITPALSSYAHSGATNAHSALLDLELEPIEGTSLQRISSARINAAPASAGQGYKVNDRLYLQTASGYNAIQYQGSDSNTPKSPCLLVKSVNETGGITELDIINQGGQFTIKPPTEITFKTDSGAEFRAVVQFRRIPKYQERLPADTLPRDHAFWKEYSKRLIGDWIRKETTVEEICIWARKTYLRRDLTGFHGNSAYIRDNDAQKAFSKLRSAQAALYAWRRETTDDPVLRKEYELAADFAFRQAIAFGPINGEVAFKYADLLNKTERFNDARRIALLLADADTNYKRDPNRNPGLLLYRQTCSIESQYFYNIGKYRESALAMLYIAQHPDFDEVSRSNHMDQAIQLQAFANRFQVPIDSFHLQPGNLQRYQHAIQSAALRGATNELHSLTVKFSKNAEPTRANLLAQENTWTSLRDWQQRHPINEQLVELSPEDFGAHFSLAEVLMQLGKTNESAQSIVRSLELFHQAETPSPDIIEHLKTNHLYAPLLKRPDIQNAINKPD